MKPSAEQMLLPFPRAQTIDVKCAAKMIACSPMTVRRLLESGELHGYRLTARGWWNISYESVVHYLLRLKEQYCPSRAAEVQDGLR